MNGLLHEEWLCACGLDPREDALEREMQAAGAKEPLVVWTTTEETP